MTLPRPTTLALLAVLTAPAGVPGQAPPPPPPAGAPATAPRPDSGAEAELVLADGKTLKTWVLSADADGNLKTVGDAGAPSSVPCRSVAEVRFAAAAGGPPPFRVPRPEEVHVLLAGGDVLRGSIEPAEGDALTVRSPGLGVVRLRLESVAEIRFPANRNALPPKPPDTSQGDVLAPVQGGIDVGSVTAVGRDGVVFFSKVFQQTETLPPARLAAVYFTKLSEPPAEPDTLLAIVMLADGSSFRGRIEGFAGDRLRLVTLHRAPGGDAPLVLEAPAAKIAAVYFKNGDVVYASDLEPVRTDEYPLAVRPAGRSDDLPFFRHRRDASVEGTPLRIRGREFRKGIGAHARSDLAFATEGRFRTFAATIGIDDERGGAGSGVFVVKADGKEVYRSPLLRGTSPPGEIAVPVAKAKEVSLVVEFGDDGGVHAHADWGGARFLK